MSEALQVALVAWSGRYGGSETFTADLAGALRRLGVDARVVFVTNPGRLGQRLDDADVPHVSLGRSRGRDIFRSPRSLASAVRAAGADGAILVERGLLPAALRLGGYRETIVAVEHGAELTFRYLSPSQRWKRALDRRVGPRAVDVEVAVSDYVRSQVRSARSARRMVVIHNAVDTTRFHPFAPSAEGPCVIGWAGRLVAGKGVDTLIEAFAHGGLREAAVLRIAGGGDERARLEQIAADSGVLEHMSFVGWVDDMPEFWRSCHVVAVPAIRPESFGMTAVEAMACARPVVASALGGLAEVLERGGGLLVPPGDVPALADALSVYVLDPERRRTDGMIGRAVCEEEFDLAQMAAAYARLVAEHRRRA